LQYLHGGSSGTGLSDEELEDELDDDELLLDSEDSLLAEDSLLPLDSDESLLSLDAEDSLPRLDSDDSDDRLLSLDSDDSLPKLDSNDSLLTLDAGDSDEFPLCSDEPLDSTEPADDDDKLDSLLPDGSERSDSGTALRCAITAAFGFNFVLRFFAFPDLVAMMRLHLLDNSFFPQTYRLLKQKPRPDGRG
jgi:hypothetical protein